MPAGMTYRELKQHLRIEWLWYRNSLFDWAGDSNLSFNPAGDWYPIIDGGQPNPRLSTALGMPCLTVDADDQHQDIATPTDADTYLGEEMPWIIEWAGVPGQPLDALVDPDVPLPMCLIGNVGEGTYIQLNNPGEIQLDLGTAQTTVNPGLDYYWHIGQPLHLLVFRTDMSGHAGTYRDGWVYVNGCRAELTGDTIGEGLLCPDGMLFNYNPVAQGDYRPFIGSHFLFRVYDCNVARFVMDEIAILMFNRVRNAFPTLRWPIPVRWQSPG